ncbi:hypothetical protein M8J77_005233 [Diaphorina citri]|nr:hypothetical protein M8J77_005233 [Diaphorina citri]
MQRKRGGGGGGGEKGGEEKEGGRRRGEREKGEEERGRKEKRREGGRRRGEREEGEEERGRKEKREKRRGEKEGGEEMRGERKGREGRGGIRSLYNRHHGIMPSYWLKDQRPWSQRFPEPTSASFGKGAVSRPQVLGFRGPTKLVICSHVERTCTHADLLKANDLRLQLLEEKDLMRGREHGEQNYTTIHPQIHHNRKVSTLDLSILFIDIRAVQNTDHHCRQNTTVWSTILNSSISPVEMHPPTGL